ncbi:MAG TPA: GGDEF domain-containing protein [Thermoleophilaceae bacterium]|nr:GGDEF domain-containing protein [Thermoleophilaceae bacterium]
MKAPAPIRRQRAATARLALFGNAIPIAIALSIDPSSHGTAFYVGAAGALLAPAVVTLTSRRHPLPFYAAAYGGLPALTLLQAGTGGPASGYAILLMMAMVWFGAQASDRELAVGVGVLAGCAFLPMLVVGPPDFPVSWGHAAIIVFVGVTVAGSLRLMVRETQILTARLREQATLDDLTGLLNRRGWTDAVERELARSRREGHPVSMLLLDLDAFKQVNDTMGHEEGDRVLAETAERMRTHLRSNDVIARVGGDEFVVLIGGADPDDAIGSADRLRQGTPERAAFSAGFGVWDRSESAGQLMRRCDLALYAAKTKGGNRVEVAPQGLDESLSPA